MFFLFLLIGLTAASISIVGFSLYTGISPMPSSLGSKKRILQELPQDPKKIYELGSGWGKLAFAIAKQGHQVYAFELSFIPWFYTRCLKSLGRFKNLEISRKNFLSISLEPADIVVCYLCPGLMKSLRLKFETELKAGTIVITNCFAIPGKKPDQVFEVNDFGRSKILIYSYLNSTNL